MTPMMIEGSPSTMNSQRQPASPNTPSSPISSPDIIAPTAPATGCASMNAVWARAR